MSITKEELTAALESQKVYYDGLLTSAEARVVSLEKNLADVSIMVAEMKKQNEKSTEDEKTKKKYRLVDEKALDSVGKYGGEFKEYDDWRFEMGVFLGRKAQMPEFIEWIATLKDEPTDLKQFKIWMKNEHNDVIENDVIKDLNDQL